MLNTQGNTPRTDIPSSDAKAAAVELVKQLKPNILGEIVARTIDEVVAKRGVQGIVGLIAAAANAETEYLGILSFDGHLWSQIDEADDFLSWATQCSDEDWAAHRRRVDNSVLFEFHEIDDLDSNFHPEIASQKESAQNFPAWVERVDDDGEVGWGPEVAVPVGSLPDTPVKVMAYYCEAEGGAGFYVDNTQDAPMTTAEAVALRDALTQAIDRAAGGAA